MDANSRRILERILERTQKKGRVVEEGISVEVEEGWADV